MTANGGTGPERQQRRSRLDEYAAMTVPERTGPGGSDPATELLPSAPSIATEVLPLAPSPPTATVSRYPDAAHALARDRHTFPALLGEFRRTAVLVPLVPIDGDEAPLAADFGGIRWIYAFSDELALARFATARGEGSREWAYRRVLGARLLDVGVRATGTPCGVALDVGGAQVGVLFPPVAGIVPDAVAVDRHAENGEEPR
ncbi:hypothetical protein [Streptomyces sp. NPDC101166]|uniref:hypothetical protein n=1 Tax=Streptomyces sp. NPDC101166 TaxID=3366120 RepID=UPI0037F8BD0D